MSTPSGLAPRTVIPGQVVQPTAIIDPKSETVHALAGVLETLVLKSLGSFHSETEQDAAMTAIRNWERQQVNQSTLNAMREESPSRAAKEDVSLRTPPSNLPLPVTALGQPIDYAKLAAAIVAATQAAEAAEAQAQQVQETNAAAEVQNPFPGPGA
jgi:hypothetical protein